jgi:uncharacterized protein with HEPN domain
VTKPWEPYARHVLDAADRIRCIQMRGDLTTDQVLYDASLRNRQTLSEATQQLPQALKDGYPEIPWRSISGFRNILVHNYLGEIDPIAVKQVIDVHLPLVVKAVQSMLDQAPA